MGFTGGGARFFHVTQSRSFVRLLVGVAATESGYLNKEDKGVCDRGVCGAERLVPCTNVKYLEYLNTIIIPNPDQESPELRKRRNARSPSSSQVNQHPKCRENPPSLPTKVSPPPGPLKKPTHTSTTSPQNTAPQIHPPTSKPSPPSPTPKY